MYLSLNDLIAAMKEIDINSIDQGKVKSPVGTQDLMIWLADNRTRYHFDVIDDRIKIRLKN